MPTINNKLTALVAIGAAGPGRLGDRERRERTSTATTPSAERGADSAGIAAAA